MCEINGEKLFCTCTDENKLEGLFWILIKVKEKSFNNWYDMMQGRTLVPSKKIEDITDVEILERINSEKCFDFEYIPNENDLLLITEEMIQTDNYSHICPYICFEFSKGKWEINYFSDLNIEEIVEIKKGKLNTSHNKV